MAKTLSHFFSPRPLALQMQQHPLACACMGGLAMSTFLFLQAHPSSVAPASAPRCFLHFFSVRTATAGHADGRHAIDTQKALRSWVIVRLMSKRDTHLLGVPANGNEVLSAPGEIRARMDVGKIGHGFSQ